MPPSVDSSRLNTADLQKTVRALRLVAHSKAGSNLSSNHWTLYFQTGSRSSVHLDMAPDIDDSQGTLVVSSEEYLYSSNDKKVIIVKVTPDKRMAAFQDLILSKNRHKFRFASDPNHPNDHTIDRGARHWVKTVVKDLKDHGLVDSESAESIRSPLKYYYYGGSKTNNVPVKRKPKDIVEGEFF